MIGYRGDALPHPLESVEDPWEAVSTPDGRLVYYKSVDGPRRAFVGYNYPASGWRWSVFQGESLRGFGTEQSAADAVRQAEKLV